MTPMMRVWVAGLVGLTLAGCEGLLGEEPTITDKSSPYYDRPCPLVQQQKHKSKLLADCRCFNNQAPSSGIDLCKRPYNLMKAGISVGEGPSIAPMYQAEYYGGFLDEAEGPEGTLYVAAGLGPSTAWEGLILTVDVATGDRTVILEPGPHSGPSWGPYEYTIGHVLDVRPAHGRQLYAFVRNPRGTGTHVLQVDRDTGATELKWSTELGDPSKFGFCETPESPFRLQLSHSGFAVDPEGRVYIGFSNPTQGRGIMRLSADFTQCEVVTGNGIAEATRGEGPYLSGFIQGFTLHAGQLWAFSTQPKQFFSVDLDTGDRTLWSEPGGVTPTERWAVWDDTRQVWWLAGMTNGVSIDAFDPATGKTALIFEGGVFPWMPLGAGGPVNINSLNYAPIWLRSNGNLLVAQDGFSIVEFEPSTGNSIIISL